MPTFMLCHSHDPAECRFAFAAWKGTDSPLRHNPAISSCAKGGHRLWWTIQADTADSALSQLPAYLAERTEVVEVSQVPIP